MEEEPKHRITRSEESTRNPTVEVLRTRKMK
jgi:hypothetical protein